jgi:hypothetical protein
MFTVITHICPVCGAAVRTNPDRPTHNQKWFVVRRRDAHGDLQISLCYNHWYEGSDTRTRVEAARDYDVEPPARGVAYKKGKPGRIQRFCLNYLKLYPGWTRRGHLQRLADCNGKSITKAMRSLVQRALVCEQKDEQGRLAYSAALRATIAARAGVLIEQLLPGQYFLMGQNIARITRITSADFHFVRLNTDGSGGDDYSIPRFDGQNVQIVTRDELQEAIRLARGGFKAPDVFAGLNEAARRAIEQQSGD